MQVQVPRKNYKRSIRTYVFVTIFLLAGAAVYGYFQYTKLAMAQEAITQEDQQLVALTDLQGKFHNEYLDSKSAYDTEFQKINEQIENVFPLNDDYTALTQKLDDYVNYTLNSKTNPIFMSNLSYGAAMEGNGDYRILPFTVTLETTRKNFEAFMRFVQNSGELQEGTRLMDVKSLSLSFGGAPEGGEVVSEPMLNVNMTVNAFFQKPAAGTTNTAPPA